ncbi:uncharacterized protein LOC114245550 isoform X5 [Bombyx mandarina]|uniref:Uncharacterized protein LOC114245550 isoform X4 n=1 Tax=Bombyx mandarina TaxID=7092 RepID=A0A6J2JXK5_BOMMA|nr:uncharacterized protein LOC114245550 isoform X4 [Bombyx mandarina]XP_028033568.1 uncharacterized protein LOC114245550 isoform X5 [Bombyx mandarina]
MIQNEPCRLHQSLWEEKVLQPKTFNIDSKLPITCPGNCIRLFKKEKIVQPQTFNIDSKTCINYPGIGDCAR